MASEIVKPELSGDDEDIYFTDDTLSISLYGYQL